LAIGEPKSKAAIVRSTGAWTISSEQLYLMNDFVNQAVPLGCLFPDLLGGKGRGLSRVATWLTSLENDLQNGKPTTQFDKDINDLVAVAQPVEVAKVEKRLPAECGLIDPVDWLTEDRQTDYAEMDKLVCRPTALRADLPVPCYRVPQEQEAPLRSLLLDSKATVAVPEDSLETTMDG